MLRTAVTGDVILNFLSILLNDFALERGTKMVGKFLICLSMPHESVLVAVNQKMMVPSIDLIIINLDRTLYGSFALKH